MIGLLYTFVLCPCERGDLSDAEVNISAEFLLELKRTKVSVIKHISKEQKVAEGFSQGVFPKPP